MKRDYSFIKDIIKTHGRVNMIFLIYERDVCSECGKLLGHYTRRSIAKSYYDFKSVDKILCNNGFNIISDFGNAVIVEVESRKKTVPCINCIGQIIA